MQGTYEAEKGRRDRRTEKVLAKMVRGGLTGKVKAGAVVRTMSSDGQLWV